jgi:hypothetical protein
VKRRNQPAHSHLFQVRMWREDLGAGQTEWRGKLQHVIVGHLPWISMCVKAQGFGSTFEECLAPTDCN